MIEELLFQLLNSLIIRIYLGFRGVELLLDRRRNGTRILVGIVCLLCCKAGSDKQCEQRDEGFTHESPPFNFVVPEGPSKEICLSSSNGFAIRRTGIEGKASCTTTR